MRTDATPDLFPEALPVPPRPHRWQPARNDAWRLAQEFCDRMRLARDAEQKDRNRRAMIEHLKGAGRCRAT
jgi:hypothetical protein